MGVTFTPEQQKVIDLRDRNILVSAAAGSGKTAVLVERIITRLTKDENPIGVDELLVVTFTEAAASEMKERIRNAIEKALKVNPDNEHLQRQASLIHSARVTTIHSFCLSVIRDYFHVIDMDPGFRIVEEGERKLLMRDVMDELLESYYEDANPDFLSFVECYAPGKDDRKIEEMILQLYEYSRSYPEPDKWLKTCVANYQVMDVEALEQTEFARLNVAYIRAIVRDLQEELLHAKRLCNFAGGPYMYEETIESDLVYLDKMNRAETLTDLSIAFRSVQWAKLKPNKDKDVSKEMAESVKGIRDAVKKQISEIAEQFFYTDLNTICVDLRKARNNMEMLVELVIAFGEQFAAKKAEKNMIDFGDMEHFALRILTEDQGGELVPSSVAKEYQAQFAEVMIDEYQDSNLIQETILTSVSRIREGQHNIFMVGDVKQSIYRFRLSRPELFMEKYNTYSLEDGECQRIDLHKNFRSRGEVLQGINYIFEQIMTKDFGKIVYDESAALHVGASYEDQPGNETELLLFDTNIEEGDDEKLDESNRELEARAVAVRIKQLVGKHLVLDKETGQYRPAQYRDIVILTRSLKGWTDVFARVLNREGIPTYCGSKEGYFETMEIRTILEYLRILDNPRQDIAFAAVLTSCFVGLESEELALIQCEGEGDTFYEKALSYVARHGDTELAETLSQFFKRFEHDRSLIPYTAIHDLLWMIIEETGYGDYIASMPAGEQRKANLDMLIEKAFAYENTSYKGLFHFVRYIEQLNKYQIDYGEADVLDEHADTVRMMSIHKSKGLEFPIVFVCGMSKRFNISDIKGNVIIHPELGVGIDCIDPTERTKTASYLKRVIQTQVRQENAEEELRVLYVALTRAKEKLIMTGTVCDFQSKWDGFSELLERKEKELSFYTLSKSKTYLDWVLPALYRDYENKVAVPVFLKRWNWEHVVEAQVQQEIEEQYTKKILQSWDDDVTYDAYMRSRIEEQFGYKYPYAEEQKFKQKMTVSELKKLSYYEADEEVEFIPMLPKFQQEEVEVSGATRGSAYHRLLELLNFAESYDDGKLRGEMDRLVGEGRMSAEMMKCIFRKDILQFLDSALGKRMQQAAVCGRLRKEQPFVLGVDANELYPDVVSEETLLIQGIIDVFFEEDGELVLLDYKTDRTKDPMYLQQLYKAQLDYYARALEQITGKHVKQKLIYSFALKKEIEV